MASFRWYPVVDRFSLIWPVQGFMVCGSWLKLSSDKNESNFESNTHSMWSSKRLFQRRQTSKSLMVMMMWRKSLQLLLSDAFQCGMRRKKDGKANHWWKWLLKSRFVIYTWRLEPIQKLCSPQKCEKSRKKKRK